jgi:hypothetical protein
MGQLVCRYDPVTFSWINREHDDGEFRYCLCSKVGLYSCLPSLPIACKCARFQPLNPKP